MARVTVEDCVDKVPNRFELVLLAAHRARTLTSGSNVTVEPENDKYAVIALREFAEKTVQAMDVREGLIHSMQHNAELDEPESTAVPTSADADRPMLVRDEQRTDRVANVITEEELLRGLGKLTPIDLWTKSGGNSGQGA